MSQCLSVIHFWILRQKQDKQMTRMWWDAESRRWGPRRAGATEPPLHGCVSIRLNHLLVTTKGVLPHPSNALESLCVLNFKSPAAKRKNDSNPNRYHLMRIAWHTKIMEQLWNEYPETFCMKARNSRVGLSQPVSLSVQEQLCSFKCIPSNLKWRLGS